MQIRLPRPRSVRAGLGVCAAAGAAFACGFADVFSSPRVEPIVITYVGDTALTLTATVPFRVVVTAGGTTLERPHVTVVSSDSTRVAVTPGEDSLRAVAIGQAVLTLTFRSSMLTDSARTATQTVRVRP